MASYVHFTLQTRVLQWFLANGSISVYSLSAHASEFLGFLVEDLALLGFLPLVPFAEAIGGAGSFFLLEESFL